MALNVFFSTVANCASLGVIDALKITLASKLQPQGANWRVMTYVIIFTVVSTKFHFDETISLAGLVSLFDVVRSSHIYGNFAMG